MAMDPQVIHVESDVIITAIALAASALLPLAGSAVARRVFAATLKHPRDESLVVIDGEAHTVRDVTHHVAS